MVLGSGGSHTVLKAFTDITINNKFRTGQQETKKMLENTRIFAAYFYKDTFHTAHNFLNTQPSIMYNCKSISDKKYH